MVMSAGLEEATGLVGSLRVAELRSLLTTMGIDKKGLKKDLVQRATEFLRKEFHPGLLCAIWELYNQRHSTNRANSRCSQVITMPTAAEIKVDCSKKSDTNLHRPVPKPEVQMIKLPFYHTLETIVSPISLVSKFETTLQTNKIMFSLTSTQWAQIVSCQENEDGQKSVQVVLRLCYTESIGVEEDQYPRNLTVWVNSSDCCVQAHYSSSIQLEPSRPCCPINLTPHLNQYSTNIVFIMWENIGKHYSVAVHLVRVFSSTELLAQLKTKGAQSVTCCKERICEKLCSSPENEITTTGLQVSLICPLAKMRMTIPCRALTCTHLQCFDAAFFLQMNERKPTWMCPICHKPALFETLQIDSLLSSILNCTEEAVKEIKYLPNGSWRAVENRTSDLSTINHATEVNPVVRDFVDLTLGSSDSDADDDLVDAVLTEERVLTNVKTRKVCFSKSTMHVKL